MKDSQQEIKATVTVNTSDMAAKAHEDKEGKEIDKISRKRGSGIGKIGQILSLKLPSYRFLFNLRFIPLRINMYWSLAKCLCEHR